MSSTQISQLPAATAVGGTDLVPIVQNGQTLRATASQMAAVSLDYPVITTSYTAGLASSRVLTAGSAITITDDGAGSTVTISVNPNPQFSGVAGITVPRGTTAERPAAGTDGTYLRYNTDLGVYEYYVSGVWASLQSSGVTYVSSVGLGLPAEFTVSGSPVTSTGTLSASWANAAQNYVFAAPAGSSGTPEFRALVAGDIPSLPYVSAALTSANIIVGNGSNVAAAVAMSGDASIANTGAVTVAKFNGGTSFGDMAAQSASSVAITGGTATFSSLHAGDVGTEGSGININGATFQSTFKVSDIDGGNFAQTILHRHSTVLEPVIVGARSNTNDTTHADVTAGMNVFTLYGSGWAGSNYKLFGQISVAADTAGTISNTSAPGKMVFSVTPNGGVSPVAAITISNSGAVAFASSTVTAGGAQVATVPVANSSLAQAAAYTLKGNNTSGTANVADLTAAQAADILSRYLELSPRWYS